MESIIVNIIVSIITSSAVCFFSFKIYFIKKIENNIENQIREQVSNYFIENPLSANGPVMIGNTSHNNGRDGINVEVSANKK